MLNKMMSTVFSAVVVAVGVAGALWLAFAGHFLQVEGLMLVMAAILGAVVFGFRLKESLESGRLSLWAGPRRSMRFPLSGV